jgi:RNA recognition motif-containing protein
VKKLFVGSLAWATDDAGLRAFFEQFGTVAKAEVVRERDTNRSRGFGFVEFEDDAEADKAIAEGDGKDLDGRNITVSEAQSKGDRGDRGGSRGGYGGGRDNNRGGGFRQRSW